MKSQIQKKKKKKKVELWNYLYQHFSKKKYEVDLNWRTNDNIMSRFGRSFIDNKCIFQ